MASPIKIKFQNFQVDSSRRLNGTIKVTLNSAADPPKTGEPLAITLIPMQGAAPKLDDLLQNPGSTYRTVEYLADNASMKSHKTDSAGTVSFTNFQLPWGNLVDGFRILVRCFTVKKHPESKYVGI
jgi:hypothetical protein